MPSLRDFLCELSRATGLKWQTRIVHGLELHVAGDVDVLSLALESMQLALKTGAISPFYFMDATTCTESSIIVHNKHWGCKMLRYHISHVRLERSHNRSVAWLRAACCICLQQWMCGLERWTRFHQCLNARAHDHNPARQGSTVIDFSVQTGQGNDQRLCGW